ncbi:hypothetical protein AVEN_153350-1 [Araneus ventricosus]|uniref:Uncharacterized protein n=1 Tax=Araneus ventricosus TaxID=182803 RepID=A0A4Y2UUI0_ARAVE|nr:hypothetical protein AVEN_153350-1 [Araneus ventricosus]
MKRGCPSTRGSSRNSNYYVKKFRPSKHGGTSIENYFKSTSSSSNKTDPRPVENSSTNENVSLSPSDENIFTSQPSTSHNTEICVSEDTGEAINPTANHPSNNKSNENTFVLRFDESSTATFQPSTSNNTRFAQIKKI